MSRHIALSLAAALSLSALAACSKPAEDASASAGDAGQAASDAGAGAMTAGGAVSPPEANGAVNTDSNQATTDTAAASTSFTEDQAKGHIEAAGYTDVSGLTKTADGMWTGKAMKGGKAVNVSVDFKGAVTAH